MQCQNGHDNPDGAAFCSTCGSALSVTVPAAQPSGPVRRGRPAWLVPAGLLAAAAVGGLGVWLVTAAGSSGDGEDGAANSSAGGGPETATFDVTGTLVLHGTGDEDHGWNRQGGPCEGQGGYSDIVEGAQVVVLDSAGEPVALGALGPGRTVEDDAWYQCHFPITVTDVPRDGGIHSVEVTHRGAIPFTEDQADSLALELGR